MSLPGHSPSRILREALLEYSIDQRRNREKRRRRRRARSRPPVELEGADRQLLERAEEDQGQSEKAEPPQEQEFQPSTHQYSTGEPETELSRHGFETDETLTPRHSESLKEEAKRVLSGIGAPLRPYVDSFDSDFGVKVNKSDYILEEVLMEEGHERGELSSQIQLEETHEPSTKAGIHAHSLAEKGEPSEVFSDVLSFNEEIETVGCCKKKYHVAHDLADGDEYVQSRFIQKVFAMIFLKTFILLSYLSLVEMLSDFKEFYMETYYYHYISAGIYLLIKVTIRLTKNFRRRNRCLHIILHIMDMIALGDFLGSSLTHWLTSYIYFVVPRKILYSIGGTSLFFIYVGWFVEYDMRDSIMVGSALIVNGLAALHQILHGTILGYGFDPNLGKVTDEWSSVLIVFGVSELIMMIIMFELKSVLSGNRFSVWYSDWFFTGVYII